MLTDQDIAGKFGQFGGRFVPEALIGALDELERTHNEAMSDPVFLAELAHLNATYVGRPSILTDAKNFSKHCGGAQILLKREDLNHTGSHKINNVIGQALLTKRMGKKRVIAETGAGQHGVATATAAALMGFECVVYMGEEDVRRQSLNVARMKLLGAQVVPVTSGSRTLKDAINEAMRDWVTNVADTHYLLGTVAGPHPFPTIVRDFHSVIGNEAREQVLALNGKLPDAVLACIGGGSNAIGIFNRFIGDSGVRLIGLEAGGDGIETGRHASTISGGTVGVLHGTRTVKPSNLTQFQPDLITQVLDQNMRIYMTLAVRSIAQLLMLKQWKHLLYFQEKKELFLRLKLLMRCMAQWCLAKSWAAMQPY